MKDNKTINDILKRRTIREYKDKKVSRELLSEILNCAMWAPSARNLQPCHVRVITDKDMLEELNTDFKNKVGWDTPAYSRWDTNPVYQGAPALFLIYAENESFMDAGIMVENIALAAEGLGLGSCIIRSLASLLEEEEGVKWKKIIGIPENWHFLIACAVGYKNEDPEPKERHPENFRIL